MESLHIFYNMETLLTNVLIFVPCYLTSGAMKTIKAADVNTFSS